MATAAPIVTLFTQLHPGAEKTAFLREVVGISLSKKKTFPRSLLASYWPLLCHMQSMAEIMDWDKPLEVKDPGDYFDSLCTYY